MTKNLAILTTTIPTMLSYPRLLLELYEKEKTTNRKPVCGLHNYL